MRTKMRIQTKRKIQKAGDIRKSNVFKYIRSIGFEIESQNFFKLTEQDGKFYNIGTNRKTLNQYDLKLLPDGHSYDINLDADDEDVDNDCEQENQCFHLTEYFQEYVNGNEQWVFEITNDISNKTKLANRLRRFPGCKYNRNEYNNRYELLTYPNGTKKPTKTPLIVNLEDCGPMYEAEWVYTYYNIGDQQNNTILSFLKRTVDHLYNHLNNMVKQKANLLIHNANENIVAGPPVDILHSKTGTNLHYFQYNGDYAKKNVGIEDALLTIQTTFSTNVEHIHEIYSHIIENTIVVDNEHMVDFTKEMTLVNIVDVCVKEMIKQFNTNNPNNKLVEVDKYGNPTKNIIVKKIKSYLFLIFYKLYQYLSNHQRIVDKIINKTENEDVYFKNFMALNPRHSTLSFYKRIIELLCEYYNGPRQEIIPVFQELINQPDALKKTLYRKMKDSVGYNNEDIDSSDPNYGDPWYSLLSYFKHFEDVGTSTDSDLKIEEMEGGRKNNSEDEEEQEEEQAEDEEEEEEQEEEEAEDDYYIPNNDWLTKKRIDIQTDDMTIHDDIILAEIRVFPRLLHNYLISKNARNEKVGGILLGDLHRALKPISFGPGSKSKRTRKRNKPQSI
jgi:hypothetical protein